MRPDWIEIRAKYEAGASQGSLAKKYGISRTAIGKHVQSEGWTQDVSRSIQQKVDAKVAGIVAGGNPKKTAAALDEEAQKRADLIISHRKEWEVVGGLRNMALECINRSKGNDDPSGAFERMKLAKITAEMTEIKQRGERRAYGFDSPSVAPMNPIGFDASIPPDELTEEQLDRLVAKIQAECAGGKKA